MNSSFSLTSVGVFVYHRILFHHFPFLINSKSLLTAAKRYTSIVASWLLTGKLGSFQYLFQRNAKTDNPAPVKVDI